MPAHSRSPFAPLGFPTRLASRRARVLVTRELLELPEPRVFAAISRDWPLSRAFARLRSDEAKARHLALHSGHRRIEFARLSDGKIGYDAEGRAPPYFDASGTVSELVEQMLARFRDPRASAVFAQSRPLCAFPELAGGLEVERAIAGLPEASTRVWIGSGGHVNGLHADFFGNVVFMVAGFKRFLLLPPEVIGDLYPTVPRGGIGGATSSRVDLLELDLERFPRASAALREVREAVLRPGDALWIPPNWWHQVESARFNVMVNTWVHSLRRPRLSEVERLLRGAIRANQRAGAARSVALRRVIESLSSNRAGPGSRRTDARLEALIRRTRPHTLPSSWRTFLAAAVEYYLGSAGDDDATRSELDRYAAASNRSERFITKVQ